MRGPRESLRRPRLPKFGETYQGAIYLGPRIIAIHSPAIPGRQIRRRVAEDDRRSAGPLPHRHHDGPLQSHPAGYAPRHRRRDGPGSSGTGEPAMAFRFQSVVIKTPSMKPRLPRPGPQAHY
jgi:hypothetical protein